MPTPQIKDENTYQALRRKATARRSRPGSPTRPASSSRKQVGARGGKSPSYDEWTKKQLTERAREIGIKAAHR